MSIEQAKAFGKKVNEDADLMEAVKGKGMMLMPSLPWARKKGFHFPVKS
ncbi:MAG: hypothetical protein WAM60_16095 [Candidatus Promineifilaceae bacterium]